MDMATGWWIPGVIMILILGVLGTAYAESGDQDLQQQVVFKKQDGGYDTYRIPAIVRTQKNTLLFFCEGRKNSSSDSGDIDLLMRRSLDNGKTWEPVQVLVNRDGYTCGNPCPIVDRNTGAIVLVLGMNKAEDSEHAIVTGAADPRTTWVAKSTDDGVTWTSPVEITSQVLKPGWRWYAVGPCHGLQLQNGTLIAPCDYSTGPKTSEMFSHLIVSHDGGTTWTVEGVQSYGKVNECTILERVDGSLYLNMRSYRGQKCRAVTIGSNDAKTWSPVVDDTALPEPVCQASVLRYSTEQDGGKNRILFSNPASTKRENMTVKLSYDEGQTWPVARTLWQGPAAYSDLVALPDGAIGCTYECGEIEAYETITFARFTLGWLTNGSDTGKPQ